jgi:hypothetical protein
VQEGELKDRNHGMVGSAPSSFDGNLRRRCQRAICRLINFCAAVHCREKKTAS